MGFVGSTQPLSASFAIGEKTSAGGMHVGPVAYASHAASARCAAAPPLAPPEPPSDPPAPPSGAPALEPLEPASELAPPLVIPALPVGLAPALPPLVLGAGVELHAATSNINPEPRTVFKAAIECPVVCTTSRGCAGGLLTLSRKTKSASRGTKCDTERTATILASEQLRACSFCTPYGAVASKRAGLDNGNISF